MSNEKRGKYFDFDEFKYRLIIRGTLKAVSPLHIGSGESMVFGPDSPVVRMYFVDKDTSVPYIPGSSLKGLFRTYTEKIAKLDPEEADLVCSPPNTCEGSDVCIVCGMFGSQTLASHIKVMDAYPIDDDIPVITKIGIRINRLTGTVGEGALFQIQAVAPGSSFNFEMTVENIPPNDKRAKYIVEIIDALQSGELLLGGKTSTGLGRVKLENLEVVKLSRDMVANREKPQTISFEEFKQEVLAQ